MTMQRLHPSLAAVDLFTKQDFQDAFRSEMDALIRDQFRGMKVMKLPILAASAAGTTLNLSQISPGMQAGPESGFIWNVRRILVSSSVLTDTARYVLYSGSDPTNFDNRHILEGFVPAVIAPTPPQPTVGASPWTYVNTNPYGVNVTISGGTVSTITVNGQTTGATSGTFYLLPDQFLTVTYTVAPTASVANATASTNIGQPVNVGYYPGRDVWLWPGECVYAQILGATSGNNYALTGLAYEAPGEMQGKLM